MTVLHIPNTIRVIRTLSIYVAIGALALLGVLDLHAHNYRVGVAACLLAAANGLLLL